MRFAARSVPLNWKNKIEYGRKNLRKWKIRVADTVILYYTKLKLFLKSGRLYLLNRQKTGGSV